ncbi:hypothetical protein LZ32DRAFT_324368 [Colletotrichum eremochloae]|nr:hypothetical protein LZ32DRAFT_324368 [Colletotrichum eremochloae]
MVPVDQVGLLWGGVLSLMDTGKREGTKKKMKKKKKNDYSGATHSHRLGKNETNSPPCVFYVPVSITVLCTHFEEREFGLFPSSFGFALHHLLHTPPSTLTPGFASTPPTRNWRNLRPRVRCVLLCRCRWMGGRGWYGMGWDAEPDAGWSAALLPLSGHPSQARSSALVSPRPRSPHPRRPCIRPNPA